jgi:hypothetical protein
MGMAYSVNGLYTGRSWGLPKDYTYFFSFSFFKLFNYAQVLEQISHANNKIKKMGTGLRLIIFIILTTSSLRAQKFDGFVITNQDSLFKGYMKIALDGQAGRRILITNNKKKKPRSFYVKDLKYYAYKKDTSAILRNFYPFVGEDYQVEWLEAEVLISKGKLKLYYATPRTINSSLLCIRHPQA